MLTGLWLFLYGLKTPMTIIAVIGSIICALSTVESYLTSKKSPYGHVDYADAKGRLWINLHSFIFLAVLWSIIFAIPSPTYNVQYVEKKVPVQVPVVKYTATRVITHTISSTYDKKFDWCINSRSTDLEYCTNFAKQYLAPRIVRQIVKVPYYAGVRVVEKLPSYDERFRWCNEKTNASAAECHSMTMESTKNTVVKTVTIVKHDSYKDLFDDCNQYSVDSSKDPVAARTERTKVCSDMAFRGSR